MPTCLNCGRENPDDAAFCMACATRLEPAAPALEVRKTVTALFCDLVGSEFVVEADRARAFLAELER